MAEAESAEAGSTPLKLEREGALAIASMAALQRDTLMRPEVLMSLSAWYPSLARDSGIYAAVIQTAPALASPSQPPFATPATAETTAALARLVWQHECFSKPTVALIDAAIDATGLALTTYGTHRVAGAGFRLRISDPADVATSLLGAAHPLARLPDCTGLYLAMTGAELGPADALAVGLVTHALPAADFHAIAAALANANPVDPELDDRQREMPPGPLVSNRERIRRYFDAPSAAEIVARLGRPLDADRDWASDTLARLRSRSPLGVCVAFAAVRNAARLDVRAALEHDYRLAVRLAAESDLIALRHISTMEDMPADAIEHCFARLDTGELQLPSRADMQRARV